MTFGFSDTTVDFFRLSNNTAFERHWTHASHIEPTSYDVRWRCTRCGRAAHYPSATFDVVTEGGSAYPDMLGCGAYPLLIVSEQMLLVLNGAGIDCFKEFYVGVTRVEESELRPEDAPRYFRLEVTGECMIDLAASGAAITDVCQQCGLLTFKPSQMGAFQLIEGSWNGSDLFRDHRHFPSVTFCTRRVVDLVEANGLTNCSFKQMG